MIELKDTPLWRRLVIAPLFFRFVYRITRDVRSSAIVTWNMVRF